MLQLLADGQDLALFRIFYCFIIKNLISQFIYFSNILRHTQKKKERKKNKCIMYSAKKGINTSSIMLTFIIK